ncbi:MAG: type II/IV secretion system protein [Armatimonadetes bacterium]|nr:type II/IV secretion system protein [Armatimonadota bacterium]
MASADEERLVTGLMKLGILTADQVNEARQQAEASGINLTQTLLRLRLVTAADIARAVAEMPTGPAEIAEPADLEQTPAPAAATPPPRSAAPPPRKRVSGQQSLSAYTVDPDALRDVPRSVAERYLVLPIEVREDSILVAMADASNVFAIDEVRSRTGRRVEAIEVPESELRAAIEQYYANFARSHVNLSATTKDLGESISSGDYANAVDKAFAELLDQAPVVRIVEGILREAVRMRASDIHIEPRAENVAVRFRIDGKLQTHALLPADMHRYALSRIKILADEDIAETRIPQDGRFATIIDGRPIDLRVSTLPTFWGEKAVLRILDKSRTLVSLSQLGFLPDMRKQYEELINMTQGILLVTGPTGSGKTTTLYASLHTLNDESTNITTIEDPIEYEISGLNQVQVHPQINLTFASALRSILRQDPDIILVGEIRDLETAEMAFRAALTGHLVLSTLHTNDAPGAATRLVDMGIAPYLISSTVIGVLAQRLVRRLCSHCREGCDPSPEELERLQLTPEQQAKVQFHRARGCAHCRNTGYQGRIALYELMPMNNEIREGIQAGMNAAQLRQVALKAGMRSLKFDGLAKVHQGLTSAAEVVRVMFASDVL